MGVGESAGDLAKQTHGFGDRERGTELETLAERFALDERHGKVRKAGDLARRQ